MSAGFNTRFVVTHAAHGRYLWDEAVRKKIAATRGSYTNCSADVYEESSTKEDD